MSVELVVGFREQTAIRIGEDAGKLGHQLIEFRSCLIGNFAIIHTGLHQEDQALEDLQKAYDEKDWALMVLAVEPRLDPLRSDSRFQESAREVGLQRQGD